MNYLEDNPVLGLIVRIKAQTKEKVNFMNCKCYVAEGTCFLCSKLDYKLMTCFLNKCWKTQFCCTKVHAMKDKILQESQKIEYDQSKDEELRKGYERTQ